MVTPEVRVRYADTDRMGYAYYANYLVWFEVGRNEWMRNHGLPYVEVEAAGCILPVVSASARYHRPARYDDLLRVNTWVKEHGRASVEFEYEVVREEETLVTGNTLHACTSREGRILRMPATLRHTLDRVVRSGEGG